MKKLSLKMVALVATVMMSLTAQAETQDVGGRVIDQNGEPLGFVSVALLSADSTYIQGATSDENGEFMIQTSDACCILRLSFIGYKTTFVNVSGSDVGTIQMKEDQPMLSEIVVKGQMPKTKLTGNSMITTIQGTILGNSGTAKEMLSKVPGMTLKGEDLEVLGKGTPIIYINGRKMHDKNELKRLRSEEIASVEVITNPGAQYDATISSVVRIKTIRREGDGFGFDVNTGLNQDLRFGESDPSAQLNLRYRHNNLDLFGMLNYWKWDETTLFYDTSSFYLPTEKGVKGILQAEGGDFVGAILVVKRRRVAGGVGHGVPRHGELGRADIAVNGEVVGGGEGGCGHPSRDDDDVVNAKALCICGIGSRGNRVAPAKDDCLAGRQ